MCCLEVLSPSFSLSSLSLSDSLSFFIARMIVVCAFVVAILHVTALGRVVHLNQPKVHQSEEGSGCNEGLTREAQRKKSYVVRCHTLLSVLHAFSFPLTAVLPCLGWWPRCLPTRYSTNKKVINKVDMPFPKDARDVPGRKKMKGKGVQRQPRPDGEEGRGGEGVETENEPEADL